MAPKKIVITGAPGTGKTVLINALEEMGFVCYHEVIRTLTAAARQAGTKKEQKSNPLVFVDDPLQFNLILLKGRLGHFLEANKLEETKCFFDRGIPDVLAYMDYFKQDYNTYFERVCEENLYDQIFILPPWREIYVRDNERLETFEEAEALHGHLLQTYERFGYTLKIVPPDSIKERVAFIIENYTKN